jgi:hypothetical protein
MEKRELCMNFLKGCCEDSYKCKYGHIIVPDKDNYIKLHEATKTFYTISGKQYEPSAITRIAGKNGVILMTKCVVCGKGMVLNESKVEIGTPQSMFCQDCFSKGEYLK